MPIEEKAVLQQIDEVLNIYDDLRGKCKYDDLSDLGLGPKRIEVAARLSSTLTRLAPPASHYQEAVVDLRKYGATAAQPALRLVPALLRALRAEYAAGYLRSLEELIHADLFADFLEMADYLSNEGYKDPAAVLAGGVLEEHLRQLCNKHGVPTADAGRSKKADTMNAELAHVCGIHVG